MSRVSMRFGNSRLEGGKMMRWQGGLLDGWVPTVGQRAGNHVETQALSFSAKSIVRICSSDRITQDL